VKKPLSLMLFAAAPLLAAGSANAYQIFSGIDNNGNPLAQVSATNTLAAQGIFLSKLVGVGTENFEAKSDGATAPLALNFGAAGIATLIGTGSIALNPLDGTNGAGRYSVPGGTKYWQAESGAAGSFDIQFGQSLAAFGFIGVDIGDFSGALQIQLFDAKNNQVGLQNVPSAPINVADGSVLFYGVIADNTAEEFNKVRFLTSGNSDQFAFDNMTIGTKDQVQAPAPAPVPLPATLALVSASLLGLGLARRRRA